MHLVSGVRSPALLDQRIAGNYPAITSSPAMPFERIAHELGFGDMRSFRRAFKRWTGTTPGASRAAALGGEPRHRLREIPSGAR